MLNLTSFHKFIESSSILVLYNQDAKTDLNDQANHISILYK